MFLPVSKKEMILRKWDYVDVVIVTGDAYIDHPSFGTAIVGRLLESHGYRVAILSQPNYNNSEDFKIFGKPRLFFGISAGNMDSIVSNYTGNGKIREKDVYSPYGNPYWDKDKSKKNRRRPDRATITYTNLAKQAFKDVPVVLGGVEASLRRFVHYDYKQEIIRASILADSKADILVYGMAERAILEIAERLKNEKSLEYISGTCERLSENNFNNRDKQFREIPSFEKIKSQIDLFMKAEETVEKDALSLVKNNLVQKQQAVWIWQNPPAETFSQDELDKLYMLPFMRVEHPAFKNVPAFKMICNSVTTTRGCSGNCSFCSIARHQGPRIVQRSAESIVKEINDIKQTKDFKGTITDLGGPTANLYGVKCKIDYKCNRIDCLYPKICKNLEIDENAFLNLLNKCKNISGVKNVKVSSGLRMELLLKTPRLLKKIIEEHLPGRLNIAPEHTEERILELMHKGYSGLLEEFVNLCNKISVSKIEYNPYFISSFPGCRTRDMKKLANKIKKLSVSVKQFQDFTPTPGTIATAMYVTGKDKNGKRLFVAKKVTERREQRQEVEKTMVFKSKR